MSSYERLIEPLLINVEKPARYTGGEYNTPNMNKPCSVRVAMCFPDLYEVGMSNLGIRILYHMLNEQEDIVAERCFAPKDDYRDILINNDIPLLSLETMTPLKEFQMIGISVQFEMLYTNVLLMLDLAKIPLFSKDRDESYPLIIAGGPCSVNPEPYAEFIDIIVVGEGEDVMLELVNIYKEHKAKGYIKKDYLEAVKVVEGVYVPQLSKLQEGRFLTVKGDKVVKQAYVKDFQNSFFPTAMLIPNIEAIHDRPVIELFRGCPNGCRFCQAGFYYRPIRMRSADRVVELGMKTIEQTGLDEMSLASLSSSDYKHIEEVVTRLHEFCNTKGVNLSLPSLRMDSFKGHMVAQSRLGSLTFAPEAGTQRLRNVINKNITDVDIDNTLRQAFIAGYKSVKLYFMLGLPTETMEDLDGIRNMVLRIKSIYSDEVKGRPLNIVVSCSVFIPKPVTPFQWEAQISYDEIVAKQNYLREKLKIKGVRFNWHGVESSILEAAFARGDRRLSDVIVRAFKKGCRFDSWSEHFNNTLWQEAFNESGIDITNYLTSIDLDERLPWDFIDFYVSKEYLIKERNCSLDADTTLSCLSGCRACCKNKRSCEI